MLQSIEWTLAMTLTLIEILGNTLLLLPAGFIQGIVVANNDIVTSRDTEKVFLWPAESSGYFVTDTERDPDKETDAARGCYQGSSEH